MTVASRIAVMRDGEIAQVATPVELYEFPASRYVAEFIGDVNVIEGRIASAQEDQTLIRARDLDCSIVAAHRVDAGVGHTVWVALRPEKLSISLEPPADPTVNCITGEVWDIGYLGNLSIYHVRLPGGGTVTSAQTNRVRVVERTITWNDTVYLTWRTDAGVVLLN